MVTVLIVDDNAELADGLREVLEDAGFASWVSLSAGEAVRRLAAASSPPDVILTDLRMPGMRIEDLVRFLGSIPSLSHVPVVLMTAAMEGSIPRDLHLDAVLLKPFKIEMLVTTLHEVIGRAATSHVASAG